MQSAVPKKSINELTRERVENWKKTRKTNQFTARCKIYSLGKMEIDAPDKSRLLYRDTVLWLTRHTAPIVSTSETSNSLNSVLQWSCFFSSVHAFFARSRALWLVLCRSGSCDYYLMHFYLVLFLNQIWLVCTSYA